MLVKEFSIENTTVEIYDDYCKGSQKEEAYEKQWEEISELCYEAVTAENRKEKKEEFKEGIF